MYHELLNYVTTRHQSGGGLSYRYLLSNNKGSNIHC